jgi:glycosyltransferase involved in cell wall biosynthesis
MKIVFISTYYSKGMGYSENCLPKALANLGHDVHILTSEYNVYGITENYMKTYYSFLGNPKCEIGSFDIDGYKVHRLKSSNIGGYLFITNLFKKLNELKPDVVHSTEIASLMTYFVATLKPFFKFKLFCESHQHLSIVKPYLITKKGNYFKRFVFKLTRTWPGAFSSLFIEKCYPIAPDCAQVAHTLYGVPLKKIKVQNLGTDTELFMPKSKESKDLLELRDSLGFKENEIICIYSGRFSNDKNPLIIAQAIQSLINNGKAYRALFIGEGQQKTEIESLKNTIVLPFMKHIDLAKYYQLADIAIWPCQESLSMLDAASTEIPIIVSNKIGETERVINNGLFYEEGNVQSMSDALEILGDSQKRNEFGKVGREKMVQKFSWNIIAKSIENDYKHALK